MMSIPSPQELTDQYPQYNPEELAQALGFQVTRTELGPALPGVKVLSEFRLQREIVLYAKELRQAADRRDQPLERVEQWHIAHELYHGLAETRSVSAWRVHETAADMWADELMALQSGREADAAC